jgi:hypothetical protein
MRMWMLGGFGWVQMVRSRSQGWRGCVGRGRQIRGRWFDDGSRWIGLVVTIAKAWQERETVGEGRRWMLASYSAKMGA